MSRRNKKFLSLQSQRENLERIFLLLICFLFSVTSYAQNVTSSIDSTSIKIGEQITYNITVEADSTDLVIFPEGQTFQPLEMFDSFEVDTTAIENRFRLIKEYALTQFDSGSYTIPRQRVIINEKPFFTDSLQVEVRNVAVDTTKQQMFPIKPSVEIEKPFTVPSWIWWLLAAIAVVGAVIFLFLRRKKKREEAAQNLPPYERAMLTLKHLDESKQLESGNIKEYYSTLTETIKRYLDEKVDERALESTTDELISHLKELKNSKKLYLKESVIQSLDAILKRADLAKFAGIPVDRITAKADRKTIEEDIDAFDKAIPEPTEEELLQDQKYREEQEKKQKRKKIILGSVAGIIIIALGIAVFFGIKGVNYVQDSLFASPSQELLHGDWIRSEYGSPSIAITTPEVLVRYTREQMSQTGQQGVTGAEGFKYGTIAGDFFISLSTITLDPQTQIDLEQTIDPVYEDLEEKGGYNIIVKNEEFTTPSGVKGIKIFGTFVIENPVIKREVKKEYMILNFGHNQGFEQVLMIFNDEDEAAQEIASRIMNSVELNTASK